MAGDILHVSLSGLRVSQNALRTVGHNIANTNTEGYSRQLVEINTSQAFSNGDAFLGNGAYTASIERSVNELVTGQIRRDNTYYNELKAFDDVVSQVNDLLSGESNSLVSGLKSFFAAAQNVADDPTAIASRQLFVSESDNLADRFNSLYSSLDTINDSVNHNIEVAINKVNNLLDNVAALNADIADASGQAQGGAPNDLLDKRDEVLKELSKLVPVQVFIQDDRQVNVTVGSGIPLVLGANASHIRLGQNEFNPLEPELYLENTALTEPITDNFSSGEVGGLLSIKETVLDPAFNELGRVSLLLADDINRIQRQGINLDGKFGTDLFFDINGNATASARLLPSANNSNNNHDLSLSISDGTQLTTSDYLFAIDNTSNVYTVTRLSDNTEVASSIMPVNFPTSIEFDGLSLDIASGTFVSGDSFLIQPTRHATRDFAVNALAPKDLALGSPIETQTSLGNLGNATISPGDVLAVVDASGTNLPLLATAGQMSPPLVVRFTSATTYDVLDNSNPANPIDLVPPLRNQVYVSGLENNLFTTDSGQTIVSSQGSALGLPNTVKANLQPGGTPAFAVTDFSGSADRFAFDVVVSNTVGAANDGTFTVNINSNSITDTASLLTDINDDLAASRVRAYMTDTGSIGFLSLDDGAADITLQNYDADPDGGTDNAPAGQANALLGFAIESTTFTTVADANGISGVGTTANDYPTETFTFTTTNATTGVTTTQAVTSVATASAKTTASALSNADGVNANAFNYMELRDFSLTLNSPLQLTVNGQDLVEYNGAAIASGVPDPALNSSEDFNDYIANQINNNTQLSSAGIYAVSAYDATNSEYYIQIHSTQGDDFSVQLEATAGESVDINDGVNNDSKLIAVGAGTTTDTVVGGRIDITLDNNVALSMTPTTSTIMGDSTSATFARSSYMGIQASISGNPQAGDTFTLNFNTDAALDNRNALKMVNAQQQKSINGGLQTYNDAYSQLVASVGVQANTSQRSTASAEAVLQQSVSLRNSISGVNLDEEAANLIRFEQLYSANAQVLNVAREIFDRLLNSF